MFHGNLFAVQNLNLLVELIRTCPCFTAQAQTDFPLLGQGRLLSMVGVGEEGDIPVAEGAPLLKFTVHILIDDDVGDKFIKLVVAIARGDFDAGLFYLFGILFLLCIETAIISFLLFCLFFIKVYCVLFLFFIAFFYLFF